MDVQSGEDRAGVEVWTAEASFVQEARLDVEIRRND